MKSITIAILLTLVFVAAAQADRRHLVWTYEYQTIPQGSTELEFYQTFKNRPQDLWEYRFELEHGLTDRWDISLYEIFAQADGEPLTWDAFQLRTRYRLGESGQGLFDPLLYLEYNRPTQSKNPNALETKLILERELAGLNLALNPVYEVKFAPGTEHEAGLDAGLFWEPRPAFSIGVESVTRLEFEDEETETQSYFGPTFSYASGKWWASAGVAARLTENGDQTRVRLLLGIAL